MCWADQNDDQHTFMHDFVRYVTFGFLQPYSCFFVRALDKITEFISPKTSFLVKHHDDDHGVCIYSLKTYFSCFSWLFFCLQMKKSNEYKNYRYITTLQQSVSEQAALHHVFMLFLTVDLRHQSPLQLLCRHHITVVSSLLCECGGWWFFRDVVGPSENMPYIILHYYYYPSPLFAQCDKVARWWWWCTKRMFISSLLELVSPLIELLRMLDWQLCNIK